MRNYMFRKSNRNLVPQFMSALSILAGIPSRFTQIKKSALRALFLGFSMF